MDCLEMEDMPKEEVVEEDFMEVMEEVELEVVAVVHL